MFSKILFTFVTKFLTSVLGFLVVVFTAKLIGAEGRGLISLIVLGTAITLLFNNIVGGNALILLAPKTDHFRLLLPSYIWAVTSCLLVTTILHQFDLIPGEYSIHVFFISLMQALASIHLTLFVAQQKIRLYNMMGILQVLILFTVLMTFLFLLNRRSVMDYVIAMYISFFIQLLVSTWFVLKELKFRGIGNMSQVVKAILENGLIIQLCNVIQILNYRLSYFILEDKFGLAALGVFSTASIVAESIWLISRSISLVQYSGIVNSDDPGYNRRLSIRMAKLSLVGSMMAYIPLILLPGSFYALVFGQEFRGLGEQIIIYSPGILALAFSTVFGHYFAGLGQNMINLWASLTGFVVTVIAAFILIPRFGINGAAFSVSLSYIASAVFLFIAFRNKAGLKIRELKPDKSDYLFLKNEAKKYLPGMH